MILFEELFKYEKFPLELECLNQLKHSTLTNYIGIPWTQILNLCWLSYPNSKPQNYYFNFIMGINVTHDNNFTICQHDDYMKLYNIFKHLKIKKVFTPLHNKNNKLESIDIIPISFPSMFSFDTKEEKDILFSFMGCYKTHHIRNIMRNNINGNNIVYRDEYHVNDNSFLTTNFKRKEEDEYKNILERSRYSLCPRGSSPSSVRFWESLAAGAIPILISDDWVLPEWDWDSTIIRIQEKDFCCMNYESIEKLLKSISLEKEEDMKIKCQNAYNFFKKENYQKYIFNFILP